MGRNVVTSRPISRRRRNASSQKQKMAKYWIDRDSAFKKMKDNRDIYLAASDITDFLTSEVVSKRTIAGFETHHDEFGIYATRHEWEKYQTELQGFRRVQLHNGSGYLFDDDTDSYMYFRIHPTHVSLELTGEDTFIGTMRQQFAEKFDFVTNEIEWLYSADGASIEIPLRPDRMPVEEMYPFLNGQSLADYYNGFMHSSASILLLIGPPGTGKTTFIRGMLQHSNTSALVSYDAAILEKDYVFANFIEGDKNMLVLEDADMFLKSRKEGNTMMHKFLNVGDGLVTTRNKKLVFSTNLPSIRDIDPALIRPGRCYDIVNFNPLDQAQAETLAKRVGTTLKGKKDKWSIADVFFEQNTKLAGIGQGKVQTTMGFV